MVYTLKNSLKLHFSNNVLYTSAINEMIQKLQYQKFKVFWMANLKSQSHTCVTKNVSCLTSFLPSSISHSQGEKCLIFHSIQLYNYNSRTCFFKSLELSQENLGSFQSKQQLVFSTVWHLLRNTSSQESYVLLITPSGYPT